MTFRQSSGEGILPSQDLWQFAQDGVICSHREIQPGQIQPASIDLRLDHEAYRVHASFLPSRSAPLRVKAKSNGLFDKTIDISEPTLLEPGTIHIVRVVESLALPSDIYGIANAKSTTGRLDIFTRLITDWGDEFDRVPMGYHGDLYLQVVSHTFPILVKSGMKLNQLRLVRGKSDPVPDNELQELAKEDLLVLNDANCSGQGDINKGLRVSVDLQGDGSSGFIGYKARRHGRPINLGLSRHYDPEDFWLPIPRPNKGYLILEPNEFYILASRQAVRVGPNHAAEMVPYDPTMGEFHVHYAGFFDPGFGYGTGGEIQGAKAVLEVRAHVMPLLLEHDQLVGRLHYYKMAATPDKVYGVSIGSSYQKQGLALSRHFKGADGGALRSDQEMAAAKQDPVVAPNNNAAKSQRIDGDDDDSIVDIAFPSSKGENRINAKHG